MHESVLGFTSDGGAILSRPVQPKGERVIENRGNADWRTRGRAPKEGSSQQQSQAPENGLEAGPVVEREEVSKKAGLQFAGTYRPQQKEHAISSPTAQAEEKTPQTADEVALSALLNGNTEKSSTLTIEQSESQDYDPPLSTGDETLDFRADVASRPDPATLDDYAAMPVEEFGMALLRGMGKKRRANGEVIEIKNPNDPQDDEARRRENNRKVRDPNQGYLGIGAKPAAVAVNGKSGVEAGLGAWGKADMRRSKNGKGEGLYTPVMLRDRRTGELITEKELEERKKEAEEARRRKEKNEMAQDSYDRRRDKDRESLRGKGELDDRRRERKRDDNDYDKDRRSNIPITNGERGDTHKRISDRHKREEDDSDYRRSRDRDGYRDRERDSKRDRRRDYYDDDDRYSERSRRRSRSRCRSRSRSRSRSRNRHRRDLEARTRGR